MELTTILKAFEQLQPGVFPHAAVAAAIAQQEAITPELLRILTWSKDHLADINHTPTYMAHLYALFLLAQFREPRAYPLIVDFFSVPGDLPSDTTGDLITEDLPRILASVARGDVSLIQQMIMDERIDSFTRGAALSSLLVLVNAGECTRADVMAYFQSLFQNSRIMNDLEVCSTLISCAVDLYPAEVAAEIQNAFQAELVDDLLISAEEVQDVLARGRDAVLAELRENHAYTLITDTIQEMSWWNCFQSPAVVKQREKEFNKTLKQMEKNFARAEKMHAVQDGKAAKVGRNDPCPCGSGKKYKKCCLNKATTDTSTA